MCGVKKCYDCPVRLSIYRVGDLMVSKVSGLSETKNAVNVESTNEFAARPKSDFIWVKDLCRA